MVKGKFVNTNGLDNYYQEYGGGRSLILLHGATDTHQFWSPFIPILTLTTRKCYLEIWQPCSGAH